MKFDYHEAEITDGQKAGTRPEDLKACLEAGVIPDAYKGILTDVEVTEEKSYVADIPDSDVLRMTDEGYLKSWILRRARRSTRRI